MTDSLSQEQILTSTNYVLLRIVPLKMLPSFALLTQTKRFSKILGSRSVATPHCNREQHGHLHCRGKLNLSCVLIRKKMFE